MELKYRVLRNKATGEVRVAVKGGVDVYEKDNKKEFDRLVKLARSNYKRAQKDALMRSCGLTKVRGAVSGSVYWE